MAIPLIVEPQAVGSRKRPRCDSATLPAASSSSNKKQRTTFKSKSNKKSVRFNEIVLICRVERIHEIDAPNVWYSKSDFIQSKRRDQRMVREQLIVQQQHEQQQQLSSQESSSSSSSSIFCDALVDVLEATTTSASTPAAKNNLKQSCAIVAESSLRGLERDILPCFRLRKRQVVANVLKSQATLQAWKATHPEAPLDHTAMILASHCRKLAQPSQRFARLLGVGDALLAASTSSTSS